MESVTLVGGGCTYDTKKSHMYTPAVTGCVAIQSLRAGRTQPRTTLCPRSTHMVGAVRASHVVPPACLCVRSSASSAQIWVEGGSTRSSRVLALRESTYWTVEEAAASQNRRCSCWYWHWCRRVCGEQSSIVPVAAQNRSPEVPRCNPPCPPPAAQIHQPRPSHLSLARLPPPRAPPLHCHRKSRQA